MTDNPLADQSTNREGGVLVWPTQLVSGVPSPPPSLARLRWLAPLARDLGTETADDLSRQAELHALPHQVVLDLSDIEIARREAFANGDRRRRAGCLTGGKAYRDQAELDHSIGLGRQAAPGKQKTVDVARHERPIGDAHLTTHVRFGYGVGERGRDHFLECRRGEPGDAPRAAHTDLGCGALKARSLKPSSLSLKNAISFMVCRRVTISALVTSSGSMPLTPNMLPDHRLIWPG